MNYRSIRVEVARIGRSLGTKDLVSASEGNITVRLDRHLFMVTATGCRLDEIVPESLVVVDDTGRVLSGGRPSSELKVHLRIYETRPDASAVIHAHPRTATAWAIARRELPWKAHPEIVSVLGRITVASYRRPSTPELADEVAKKMARANACLMANHGAVTLGSDLREARDRMEILESFAISSLFALALGGPVELSEEEIEALSGPDATRPEGYSE